MSGRSKKENRQRVSAPLVLAGVGVLILLGLAVLLIRQSDNASGGIPAVAVDEKTIDFGHVPDYTSKTFSVTVTNKGTAPLRFKEKPYVQVLEGCCPPELNIGSMILKPGESTTVTSAVFMMHPGMDGKHDYAVHLQTNDASNPDLVVHVLSDWIE